MLKISWRNDAKLSFGVKYCTLMYGLFISNYVLRQIWKLIIIVLLLLGAL